MIVLPLGEARLTVLQFPFLLEFDMYNVDMSGIDFLIWFLARKLIFLLPKLHLQNKYGHLSI